MGEKHKHNPTLSANKHVVQILPLLAIGCRRWPCRPSRLTVQVSVETSPVNGIERSLSRAVVPKTTTKSLPVSAATFPTALSLYIAQGTLAKGYPTAIQAVLKGRTVAIRKGNKHQLGLFFLLEACQRNAAS